VRRGLGDLDPSDRLERKILSSDVFRANLGLIAGILMAVGVTSASLAAIFQLIGGAFRARKGS
jgi:hypothetical protein